MLRALNDSIQSSKRKQRYISIGQLCHFVWPYLSTHLFPHMNSKLHNMHKCKSIMLVWEDSMVAPHTIKLLIDYILYIHWTLKLLISSMQLSGWYWKYLTFTIRNLLEKVSPLTPCNIFMHVSPRLKIKMRMTEAMPSKCTVKEYCIFCRATMLTVLSVVRQIGIL